MTGFRDEAQLWTWMRPKMKGKWERVECIMPEGVPDVMGTCDGDLVWIERKIGLPNRKAMEPGQIAFFEWMEGCLYGPQCWVAWGDPKSKLVRFTLGLVFDYCFPADDCFFWKPEHHACIVTA